MDEDLEGPVGNVVPLPSQAGPGEGAPSAEPPQEITEPDLASILEQAIRVALGAAALAVGVASAIIRQTLPRPAPGGDELSDERPPLPALAVGATLGFAIEAVKLAARTADALVQSASPWISFMASLAPVRRRLDDVRQQLGVLDERWRAEQPRSEEAARTFVRVALPDLVSAIVDQVDLTELVLAVDVDRIVNGVDLDRVLNRVDADAIVEKIDLNRILERIDIDRILQRVDLNEVARRIDVDAVVARIDLDAIIDRIDVTGIARQVVDDLDLVAIIREASGTMADETAEGLRAQSATADRLVARVVDRMLQRKGERDLGAPDAAGDGSER